jgi:AcrR family transcriptional regulator
MQKDSPPSGAPLDGRVARSNRTRTTIVSALLDLLLEGEPAPTAQRVADRAGVSLRSVFGHFASVGALHKAAIDEVTREVVARLDPIDPNGSTETKVETLCRQRATINEDLGPLLLAAERHASTSSELAAARAFSRQSSVNQVERLFHRDLDRLGRTEARRVAVVHALLGPHTWTSLRKEQGLSVEDARAALVEAILAVLARDA